MSLGRRRTVENGPRTISIDILLTENVVMESEELKIPHPMHRDRRFTLAPLAELNPGLRDPVTHQTMAQVLAGLTGQTARKRGQTHF